MYMFACISELKGSYLMHAYVCYVIGPFEVFIWFWARTEDGHNYKTFVGRM